MSNRTPAFLEKPLPSFPKKPLALAIGALAIPTASVFLVQPAMARTERADNQVLEMLVLDAGLPYVSGPAWLAE